MSLMSDVQSVQMQMLANPQEWLEILLTGATAEDRTRLGQLSNVLGFLSFNHLNYMKTVTQNYVQEVVRHIDSYTDTTNDNVESLKKLVNTDNALMLAHNVQFQQISTLLSDTNNKVERISVSQQQGGNSCQPKMGEIPEFNGTEKLGFKEWLTKVELWHAHESVHTDRQHITTTLSKLSGTPMKYM